MARVVTGQPYEGFLARLSAAATTLAGGEVEMDTLLVDLVARAKAATDADTAAILLLEESGKSLVARAAIGLEEEVSQGTRVPVGKGFAGRVAAERQPVILGNVDMGNVVNPILPAKGLRTMLGVPLISDGALIGVLHVGSLTGRRFTQVDVQMLNAVATEIAGEIQARMLVVERAAAELLERSLMPSELPRCPGLDLAARYVPADRGVGGDWYDVFVLPDDELWVVIGDVAGHGLYGATMMGRARTTLRAYALLGGTPSEVIERTDRKLEYFEPGVLVTAVAASSRPPYDTFKVCTAGHPAPLTVTEEGARLLALEPGLPIGVAPGCSRTWQEVPVRQLELLVFYTDGLVERRGENIDDGLARLARSASADTADAVCAGIMQALIGRRAALDDVALVAVRRIP
ncbi:MAG TPA: GAF domain-containing SpoIIE family protein phosphatase [Acidimicrobiales bacterium]|nr:GAF domain-containing SpoIIE family protein phosphatase [Acidimicrobiales bacterium]